MTTTITVQYAVYGALQNGNPDNSQANVVTQTLQSLLNGPNANGVVAINNTTMGGDPSPGNQKHFAALFTVNSGSPQPVACAENQTVDFT